MTYRIYYNRRDDYPISWCIDEGDISTQIRLSKIQLNGITGYFLSVGEKPKLPPNEPYGWLVVENADMILKSGIAVFYPTS